MKNDRLRSAMWRPIEDETKADHQRSIADELSKVVAPKRGLRVTARTAFATMTVGAVMLGGAVLAAEGSLPGEVLYPVKQLTENVRSVFDDDLVAEHRVEELDELVRRDRPTTEIDEQLVEAQVEVDRLHSDSPIREDLAGLRHDIAATRDIPETDLPPKGEIVVTLTPSGGDVPTTAPKTTAPTDTRPNDPPPTEVPPSDERPPPTGDDTIPTTGPPRDG